MRLTFEATVCEVADTASTRNDYLDWHIKYLPSFYSNPLETLVHTDVFRPPLHGDDGVIKLVLGP